jgi:tetratricopeptide (TPR) repeat protein
MKPRPTPTISGVLGTTTVASMLWSLRERELSGTLALHGECHAGVSAGETLLGFERGALTQIRQPQPLDTLGSVLREQGDISSEQFDESLARLAAREGLQGEILVAMGACDRPAVEFAVRSQLRRKAQRVFALEQGRVEFFRDADLLAGFGGARLPEDTLPLLWPGLRAHPEHAGVSAAVARLGPQALRLEIEADLAAFDFGDDERKAVELLRAGPATLAALAATGCPAGACRALVALLLLTAMARPAAPGPLRTSSGTQPVLRVSAPVAMSAPGPVPPPGPPRRFSGSNLPAVRDLAPKSAPAPTPPTAAPKPPAAGLRARLVAAEDRLKAMQDETYFQMLGVAADATASQARAAHADRAPQWRPEAAPESAIALREVHAQIHALLDEACAALTDDAARAKHMADIRAGSGTPNVRRGQAAHADALTKLHTAEVCLRCGAVDEAAKAAREALVASPDMPGAIIALVSALLAKDAAGPCVEAQGWVGRGLKLAPDNDRMHVLAGKAIARRGDAARALEHYVRAFKINPTNMEAVRELRLAAARQRGGGRPAEAAPGGGLLAKLFGR